MSIYQPYTYLIGWSNRNTFYYGARWAKESKCLYESGCHPDDLWVSYFTSSKIVEEFVKENGTPDIIRIDKTFTNAQDAIEYERDFIDRNNCVRDEKWLNKANQSSWCDHTGVARSEESRERYRESRLGELNPMYGRSFTSEHRKKLGDATRQKRWFHCPVTGNAGRFEKDEVPDGWIPDRLPADRKKKRPPTSYKRRNPIIACPHCDKTGIPSNMKRWHFDNCKNYCSSGSPNGLLSDQSMKSQPASLKS